jgi:hypothetical protein
MKYLLLIAGIYMSSIVFSQQIIVFKKGEKCYIGSKSKPCKPEGDDELAFLNGFKSASFQDTSRIKKTNLITPPLEWGKKVSDATIGEIAYYNTFPKGFIIDLSLHHLLPDHAYLLTLNGNPKLAGNDLLPDTVPNYSIEKYYDFLSIKTNVNGEYHARIGIFLKPGDYHVRFYVKDTDGFKIVLYHDYFKFTVI